METETANDREEKGTVGDEKRRKDLEQEVLELKILNKGKDYFIDQLKQDRQYVVEERAQLVAQLTASVRKGGSNFNPGYFLPTYEVIYMITKPKFRLAEQANAYTDVWDFTQEMNNPHPAPFPLALIERIISSTRAQIVLDTQSYHLVALSVRKDF